MRLRGYELKMGNEHSIAFCERSERVFDCLDYDSLFKKDLSEADPTLIKFCVPKQCTLWSRKERFSRYLKKTR